MEKPAWKNNNQLLWQTESICKILLISHKIAFTHDSFYTRRLLHQKPAQEKPSTPELFYAKNLYTHTHKKRSVTVQIEFEHSGKKLKPL